MTLEANVIYVASSWRNKYQPAMVDHLRRWGHDVYDFRNPAEGDHGFHWSNIDPEWQSWDTLGYRKGLLHRLARDGFKKDMDALRAADAVVLLLPCGRSAHAEAGWLAGAGRPVFVFIPPGEAVEPELMYKMFQGVTDDTTELAKWLAPMAKCEAGR